MIHKSTIAPGVSLTCIQTDRFKTGCLSINFIGELRRESAALNALLPRVLRRGSEEHPDMERIAAALDELYGARVEPIVRKKGELHCIGLFLDFPDDRYIPGGESVLERTVTLACGMLLAPLITDGVLHPEHVESEKKYLIDDIRANINNKRGYCIDRLIREMCINEAYGVSKLGDELEAFKITPSELTAHYRNMIDSATVEILYCGAAQPERIQKALYAAFSAWQERISEAKPLTKIVFSPAQGSPRRFSEALDITQGKMAIGFRLGKSMENPDYPALMLFNTLYGGDVTSKLFTNLREKQSLCYYVSSVTDKHKGVLIVDSGVDFSNFDVTLAEVQTQLTNIKNGKISDWEFQSAKSSVISAIKSTLDRPGGLMELYFDSSVSTCSYDPTQLCEKVGSVTLDSVVNIASGVQTDSIFCLNSNHEHV